VKGERHRPADRRQARDPTSPVSTATATAPIKNLYHGETDQNARQGSGLRGQLLATPTENLTIRVIGMHGRQSFNDDLAGDPVGLYAEPRCRRAWRRRATRC
jgi:hypothetical protein